MFLLKTTRSCSESQQNFRVYISKRRKFSYLLYHLFIVHNLIHDPPPNHLANQEMIWAPKMTDTDRWTFRKSIPRTIGRLLRAASILRQKHVETENLRIERAEDLSFRPKPFNLIIFLPIKTRSTKQTRHTSIQSVHRTNHKPSASKSQNHRIHHAILIRFVHSTAPPRPIRPRSDPIRPSTSPCPHRPATRVRRWSFETRAHRSSFALSLLRSSTCKEDCFEKAPNPVSNATYRFSSGKTFTRISFGPKNSPHSNDILKRSPSLRSFTRNTSPKPIALTSCAIATSSEPLLRRWEPTVHCQLTRTDWSARLSLPFCTLRERSLRWLVGQFASRSTRKTFSTFFITLLCFESANTTIRKPILARNAKDNQKKLTDQSIQLHTTPISKVEMYKSGDSTHTQSIAPAILHVKITPQRKNNEQSPFSHLIEHLRKDKKVLVLSHFLAVEAWKQALGA